MRSRGSIGAFFDLDGTLLPAPSLEARFFKYLFSQRLLRTSNVSKWIQRSLRPSQHGKFAANKTYLADLPAFLTAAWAESILAQDLSSGKLQFFDDGLARIAWHQAQNHRVFLISGTLAPLASEVLRFLPGEIGLMATELSTDSCRSMWTGELAGEHMVGFAKMRAMLTLAADHRLDLPASYAYGDSVSDSAMFEAVGHAAAVNPSRRLARIARQRAWTVLSWKPAKGPASAGQAKLIPITRGARPAMVEEHL